MSGNRTMTSAILALSLVVANSASATAAEADATLRAELEHISQKRIFFGHQSVGVNLLDGIKQLSATSGVPVRVTETPVSSGVPKATIGHAFIPKNGEPMLKLQNFKQAFGKQPSGVDIAMLKFCFVDINANTDAKALFAAYRATIDSLRAQNPNTTFVHVTAPLTEAKGGLKVRLKRLLGRTPYEDIESLRREEYNALMRQAYLGREPVFDIARIESTSPDGKVETLKWEGNVAPVMVPEYTDDGGHLNSVGKLRAARELVAVLAAIPDQRANIESGR
jgi:hypothetical protein